MRKIAFGVLFLPMAMVAGCDKTYVINPNSPSQTTTTTNNPTTNTTKVEFRVFGNAPSVKVRYSDPLSGVNQTITALPFSASFDTTLTSLFLSLDVSSVTALTISNPFISGQILINGNVFRQGSSSDVLPSFIISGDWRK